jgi:acylphosphatase
VEALFEGDQKSIAKMIDWCWKGPELSRVENVLTQNVKALTNFKTFEIKYSNFL